MFNHLQFDKSNPIYIMQTGDRLRDRRALEHAIYGGLPPDEFLETSYIERVLNQRDPDSQETVTGWVEFDPETFDIIPHDGKPPDKQNKGY